MADINKEIRNNTQRKFVSYFVATLIIIGNFGFLLLTGPQLTGYVTFSESVINTDQQDFTVSTSKQVKIETDVDNLNAVMLSGTVTGSGKAAVYLLKDDRRYLAYYFEGDAKDSVKFKDMCYNTCHVEGLDKKNILLFELEGTQINIDKIKYMSSRIIDFDLEPRSILIDYLSEPTSIIDLKLTNNLNEDYTVLLYIDGPLSSSFSWQGSLIHMENDIREKIIPVRVVLPNNLPKGEFVHKITARYVPPDTYDFVGESPVAETFITIDNR